jgi:integrase
LEETGLNDPASTTDQSDDASRSIRNTLISKTFKDGAIYLFQRGDYQKPIWFCRVKVPGAKGYIYRSARTSDEHQAFKFADNLYNQTLVKVLGGANLNAKKIGEAIEAYTTRIAPQRARLSIHYKVLLVERCAPFLAKKTFDELDTALLSKLITYLSQGSTKGYLSANTIKRIHSDLKHFFGWCVEEGHIDKIPKFPRIASENSRRPHFDEKDWRKLTRHLREFVKVANKATLRDRKMLVNYVLILANTGIRVGEARTLKWRDVREVRDGTTRNVVLTVKGKTGMRDVVASKGDVKDYFKAILDLRKEEMGNHPAPVSLIFCHKDGSEIGSFKKSFAALIKAANVEKDGFGQTRTIYSLRHTYATFRLHEGVNHYALAKNMGTSVAMLEQFYGHTSNVTAADELTKRKRRTFGPTKEPKLKKPSEFAWLENS